MKGVVGGSHLGSRFMYWLMRRRISMAKVCMGGERVWFSMGLYSDYLSHSHVHHSSGISVW
jgi:hypothetical protein